jgi:hypothetical protein
MPELRFASKPMEEWIYQVSEDHYVGHSLVIYGIIWSTLQGTGILQTTMLGIFLVKTQEK